MQCQKQEYMMAIDPDPTNPFEFIFRIMLALFLGIAVSMNFNPSSGGSGGGGDVNPGEPQGAQPAKVLTVVEAVDALLLESLPVQITLHVTGYQPDGCEFPVLVEQRRDGNTVTVKIYRELPPDILCTMQLLPYDENIRLDGGFEPGEYTIDVNGFVVTVTI
jgi:hypothetical protein